MICLLRINSLWRLMAAARALLLAMMALRCAARLFASKRAWALFLAIICLLIIMALFRAAMALLLAAIVLALLAASALLRASKIALRLFAAIILR